MAFSWGYPLFLIPHGAGFASIVDAESESAQRLVVYTRRAAAVAFMEEHALPGTPRALHNAREFRWMLEALRDPVCEVAFDPRLEDQQTLPRWSVGVRTLLDEHLHADLSPWNYPIWVVAQESGFACIHGHSSDGRPLTAITVFTDATKAEAYLGAAGESGTLCELADLEQTRHFLNSLELRVFAVAVDPVADRQKRTARYCFDIATLLEKYLVQTT